MPAFKTLDDLNPAGRTVLLRADLNVPVQDGRVSDTTRLARLAPTVLELCDKGARVVILSHFGRPKGKRTAEDSLRIVSGALEMLLGRSVAFADDCVDATAEAAVRSLNNGDVLLLENVRFHNGEEADDKDFALKLAKLGDVYVNDAFSAAHRAHATTHALAGLLPAYAGRLMQAELQALDKALGNPARPVTAIVGGAKISTKLDLLNNLVTRLDTLVLGGGMANTFLYAQGISVGKSLCEPDMVDNVRKITETARAHGCKILLPEDGVIAREFKANAPHETLPVTAIPADGMMLDVGAATVRAVIAALEQSKTLVWNGPLGAFETEPFDRATVTVAQAAADLTAQGRLLSVAGGGDTVAALAQAGVEDKLSYVSAAGGAFLEWMEGKTLPGVAALERAA